MTTNVLFFLLITAITGCTSPHLREFISGDSKTHEKAVSEWKQLDPSGKKSIVKNLLYVADGGGEHFYKVTTLKEMSDIDPQVITVLREYLHSWDPLLVSRAADALGEIRNLQGKNATAAVPDLIDLFKRSIFPTVRHHALQALWLMSGDAEAAIPLFQDVLREGRGPDYWDNRRLAMMALKQYVATSPRVIPSLINTLKEDHSERVRAEAADACGYIKDPSLDPLPLLIKLVSIHPSWMVRSGAINGILHLDQQKREQAVPVLSSALRDQSPIVRDQAAYALKLIENQKISASVKKNKTT